MAAGRAPEEPAAPGLPSVHLVPSRVLPSQTHSRRNTPRTMASSELSFEEAVERLESLVERLEQDDIQLEEALSAYEEGMSLAKVCQERLEDAELRIQKLSLNE